VFLSEPGRTEYDLNFDLLGFHVRTHPFFFLMCLFLGRGLVGAPGVNTGVGVLMGVLVFFVSILVHELGHSLAHRHYGMNSRIVLYAMGGMAIPDAVGRRVSLNHAKSIVISLAGPVAGFLLGVLFIAIGTFVAGHLPQGRMLWFVPFFYIINIILNVLNLLPMFPLDGGRICRSTLEIVDQWNGARKSLMVSIATAVLCGVICLNYQNTIMALFCFYLAYQNYQELNPGIGRRW
jgi:Zn-dependent protease